MNSKEAWIKLTGILSRFWYATDQYNVQTGEEFASYYRVYLNSNEKKWISDNVKKITRQLDSYAVIFMWEE